MTRRYFTINLFGERYKYYLDRYERIVVRRVYRRMSEATGSVDVAKWEAADVASRLSQGDEG